VSLNNSQSVLPIEYFFTTSVIIFLSVQYIVTTYRSFIFLPRSIFSLDYLHIVVFVNFVMGNIKMLEANFDLCLVSVLLNKHF